MFTCIPSKQNAGVPTICDTAIEKFWQEWYAQTLLRSHIEERVGIIPHF